MKKIFLFISTSRADYSQSKNLILKFKRKIPKNFFLLVSGSHLSKRHGKTINEIIKDGINPDFKINIISEKNVHINDNNKIAEITFKKFNNIFSLLKNLVFNRLSTPKEPKLRTRFGFSPRFIILSLF